MSDDEHKEGEEPVAGGAIPDLDAAFEDDDAPPVSELEVEGIIVAGEFLEEDLVPDFLEEDKDGNY